ncbi:MAG: FHA domain-containing protein [Clostridiales bacterium]|nr:FHA domain-containing protein [Clostridiales bacterium]
MNSLIQSTQLEELSFGSDFAYILSDSAGFSLTEYKVLHNQKDSIFVPCMKLLYNGKTQLYYRTDGYRSLENILPVSDPENFLTIVYNLFSAVVQTGRIGFLSCRKIVPAFDKFFVEAGTGRVRLVYLPVSGGFFPDEAAFENQLRSSLVRWISECDAPDGSAAGKLIADLSDGLLSLEKLTERMRDGIVVCADSDTKVLYDSRRELSRCEYTKPNYISSTAKMRLEALNAPERVVLYVNKNPYVIGKNPAAVDGVLSFNKMISRVHCRIIRTGAEYRVEDLGSANGTWVNRVRVQRNQGLLIRNGDILRLADTDFRVSVS